MGFWQYAGSGGIDPNTPISDLPGDLPASRISGRKSLFAPLSKASNINLLAGYSEIAGFRKTLLAEDDGLAILTWQIDTAHLGVSAASPYLTQYPIKIEGMPVVRSAATQGGLSSAPFLDVPEGFSDGVIRDVTHHYQNVSAPRIPVSVAAGTWYEFSIKLRGTATLGSLVGSDNLVVLQNNGGAHYLSIDYEPGAELEP